MSSGRSDIVAAVNGWRVWRARAASWRIGGLTLVVLCLSVYLPGLCALPPVDRDECRFAQASRQMFEAATLPAADRIVSKPDGSPGPHWGGWAVPMYQDQPRLNKGPLTYWLQVASAWLFSGGDPQQDAMWMYRVPSALAAIASVLMTWRLGQGMFDPRTAWLAAALLAICPMVVWDAHQARSDQILLACCVAAQVGLWRVFSAGPDKHRWGRWRVQWAAPMLFWAAMAAGILTKGPITPMVSGLTVLGLCLATGRWAWLWRLRPVLGLAIVVVSVGAWAWLLLGQIGFSEYLRVLNDEVLLRATVGSKEGHAMPPGLHTVLLVALFWPGSLATLAAMGRAVRRGWPRVVVPHGPGERVSVVRAMLTRRQGRSAELFLLAWIVPAWLVFELVTSKLPHYTLPMYPAIALLSARAVLGGLGLATGRVARALGSAVWLGIGVAAAVALLAGVIDVEPLTRIAWPAHRDWRVAAVVVLAAVTGVGLMDAARRALARGEVMRAQKWAMAAAVAVLAAGLQWVLPVVVPGARSEAVMRIVSGVEGAARKPIASVYGEDSMVFWTRGKVRRMSQEELDAWIDSTAQGVAVGDSQSRDRAVALGWSVQNGGPLGSVPWKGRDGPGTLWVLWK